MILKHRVCINIADSNGAREPVIRGETISLRTRLLNWLLGGKEEVLVLRPGRSVTSVEIFRDADSVLLELDMDHAIVKDIFRLAEEYGKPVFAAVSNIRIAMGRRDFLQRLNCFVCNLEEAGILFARDLSDIPPMTLAQDLAGYIQDARIRSMVITLGADGAVWADADGQFGYTASQPVPVIDTTGAGDAFFAGVSVGLTYGKSLRESCDIGTRLASSVVGTLSSTCPRFLPDEFGLDIPDAR